MAGLYRLTLLPYLQAWDAAAKRLTLNFVAYPIGDPRVSLTNGLGVPGPAIADALLVIRANLSKAVDQLPLATAVDSTLDLPLTMPAGRHALFDALDGVYHPAGTEAAPVRT